MVEYTFTLPEELAKFADEQAVRFGGMSAYIYHLVRREMEANKELYEASKEL